MPRGKKRTKQEEVALEECKRKTPKTTEASVRDVLEKGHIYFFYRPKVDVDNARNFEDVQRLYILLWPQKELGKEDNNKKRLIVVPKKKLPGKQNKEFALVVRVSKDLQKFREELGPKEHETKTRGKRLVKAARPCGEGVYSIVFHGGHTHLVYVLELPKELGEVQESFNIQQEGSFIITVKNPAKPQAFDLPHPKPPKYPKKLLEILDDYNWVPANPVKFLDYEYTQLALIGALCPTETISEELGEAGEYLEELEKAEEKRLSDDTLFKELHLDMKNIPPQPLLYGEWK